MKNLEKIRKDSREIKDKIDDTEERLRQLKNQEQKILKQDIVKRRKERTHRLMTRGVILESLIEKIKEYKKIVIALIKKERLLQKSRKIRLGKNILSKLII
ncbi:DUF3847 domain-containing protein [Aerococcus christensenii]|uniref:DUF3847 domain-containing protein n=1 Tax=Aerococcus christensenii TaxID=87541 RepID=A0A133Y436_9LACT|nr:DUF3847 domain-containing protein [Aerococcus christensenii]KXB37875.1 hypothetical protein HMPREF3187_00269 [Aerococcus christensenii]PKY91968.1 DUF3847 domain-containing protein [Aerococcus christensenii]